MENTALWNSACKTDPNYTKQFSRAGGFSGTAISPMYLVRRATETFGPIGIGWGFTEINSMIAEGVWFSLVRLWYVHDSKRGEIEQWGATTLVNKRKDGSTFIDEEAAKKSVTDAVTKCLSYLGFGADIHMGLYEDNKYMAELRSEKREPKSAKAAEEPQGSREAQQAVAERKIAEMKETSAPAPEKKEPESKFQSMLNSIQLLKAEFKELDAEPDYYAVLESFGHPHANKIKTIDEGREVYKKLVSTLKIVRANTPIPGQNESPVVMA